jgi:DNA-binding NarL/FixJ family response regulator
MDPMRVVIGEDVLLMREGIVHVLRDAGVEVVGQAGDLDSLLEVVRSQAPDIVILDIRMPPTYSDEGLVAAKRIAADLPDTGILILSQYVESEYATSLLAEYPEGVGYLLKERIFDPAILIDALRRIADGECVVDPTIVSRLVGRRRQRDPLMDLTDRERDVLSLLAEGLSNTAIAKRLVITERTVEAHTTQIFQKLGLEPSRESHRRVLAVLAYLREN